MSDYYMNGGGRSTGRGRNGRGGRGRGGRGRGRRGGGRGNAHQNAYVVGGRGPQPNSYVVGGQPIEEEEPFKPGPPQPGSLFGLPDDVTVPGTINNTLLQGEILETLKRMPSDQIDLVFKQFDTCAKEGGIRNRNSYLLGIINSGPRMGLPRGVIVPASVKFSLMHGVVLEDLRALPISLINKILLDFDNQVREKGDYIQDRYSFMAELIRSHRKESGIEDMPTRRQQNQSIIEAAKEAVLPSKNGEKGANSPSTENTEMMTDTSNDEMEETLSLLANSLEKVNHLTESLDKVRAELIAEKGKRNSMEAIAKSEKALREATEEQLQSARGELAEEREIREKEKQEYETTLKYEQDRRAALEKAVEDLKENINMERMDKKQAEDRLAVLEEVLISERDVRDQERFSVDGVDLPNFDVDSDCESHD